MSGVQLQVPLEAVGFSVIGAAGRAVTTCYPRTDLTPGDSLLAMAATARLFAAAPELLAAAEAEEAASDAREDCPECEGEGQWERCGPCSERFGNAIDLRRAAIAKATGAAS